MKKIRKWIGSIIIANVIIFIFGLLNDTSHFPPSKDDLIEIIVVNIFTIIVACIIEKRNKKPYVCEKKDTGKEIELSIMYLIKIKVDNKYIVKNINSIHEPISGVLVCKNCEKMFSKYKFQPKDNSSFLIGKIDEGEVLGFLESVNKKKKDFSNDLKEEFLICKILPETMLYGNRIKYLKRVYEGIRKNEISNTLELNVYDIFEIFLDENPKKYILNSKNDFIYLASDDEISSLTNSSENIWS